MDEINKFALSNNIKEKEEMNNILLENKLKPNDLKKEYHINMINTLDRFDKDKEIDSDNSEEKYLTLKNEMKRLENENQNLKNNLEQLNNLKYPDEENNSYLSNQINVSENNIKFCTFFFSYKIILFIMQSRLK